jgi:hypothetical protein
MSLFFGLLVMIVKITTGDTRGRTYGQPKAGVTRDRPNYSTGGGADGRTTQGALFGIRHARTASDCQADYQNDD